MQNQCQRNWEETKVGREREQTFTFYDIFAVPVVKEHIACSYPVESIFAVKLVKSNMKCI
jgi:hypothetical protein